MNDMQGTSAAYKSRDAAIRGEVCAGLSSTLRSTRLLRYLRYARPEHDLWDHARVFVSRASNARSGESRTLLLPASVSFATAVPRRPRGR
jgi:hypothetical protein